MSTENNKKTEKTKEETRSVLLYLPIELHKKIAVSATVDYNYATLPETIINRLNQSFIEHPIKLESLESKIS